MFVISGSAFAVVLRPLPSPAFPSAPLMDEEWCQSLLWGTKEIQTETSPVTSPHQNGFEGSITAWRRFAPVEM
jgi:hypothetical protein